MSFRLQFDSGEINYAYERHMHRKIDRKAKLLNSSDTERMLIVASFDYVVRGHV